MLRPTTRSAVFLLAASLFAITPASLLRADSTAAPITDASALKSATEWVDGLELADNAKTARAIHAVATHLQAVRAWHNSHPADTVPAGINPVTGQPLSDLDRSIIADSAMPRSVHLNLMAALRADLTEPQIEAILDRYTIGKVAFTLKGYHAIVPDLTPEEEAVILANLKEARERAIDFKNMKQISAIFEIYKTRNEQFLNSNGRDWKQLYRDYVKAAQARKAAEQNN